MKEIRRHSCVKVVCAKSVLSRLEDPFQQEVIERSRAPDINLSCVLIVFCVFSTFPIVEKVTTRSPVSSHPSRDSQRIIAVFIAPSYCSLQLYANDWKILAYPALSLVRRKAIQQNSSQLYIQAFVRDLQASQQSQPECGLLSSIVTIFVSLRIV